MIFYKTKKEEEEKEKEGTRLLNVCFVYAVDLVCSVFPQWFCLDLSVSFSLSLSLFKSLTLCESVCLSRLRKKKKKSKKKEAKKKKKEEHLVDTLLNLHDFK